VVNADGFRLINLEEKPVQRLFVNAGIYVLEPEALDRVPKNEHFDMTSLLESLQKEGQGVTVFPIHEYWLDIGRAGDYERANGEFCKHFDQDVP
jgi:NDP-sugar pyrophosphorylase family protein